MCGTIKSESRGEGQKADKEPSGEQKWGYGEAGQTREEQEWERQGWQYEHVSEKVYFPRSGCYIVRRLHYPGERKLEQAFYTNARWWDHGVKVQGPIPSEQRYAYAPGWCTCEVQRSLVDRLDDTSGRYEACEGCVYEFLRLRAAIREQIVIRQLEQRQAQADILVQLTEYDYSKWILRTWAEGEGQGHSAFAAVPRAGRHQVPRDEDDAGGQARQRHRITIREHRYRLEELRAIEREKQDIWVQWVRMETRVTQEIARAKVLRHAYVEIEQQGVADERHEITVDAETTVLECKRIVKEVTGLRAAFSTATDLFHKERQLVDGFWLGDYRVQDGDTLVLRASSKAERPGIIEQGDPYPEQGWAARRHASTREGPGDKSPAKRVRSRRKPGVICVEVQ